MTGAGGGESVACEPTPSTKPAGQVLVGPAGFSYPDWVGPVYAPSEARGRAPLGRVAAWLDLLEVNVSYYRIPAPRIALGWLETTASRPDFRFTAKLWRGYTHGPETPTQADHRAMCAFLDALGADGRLVALLAQFPPSFRASSRTEAYVLRLADHFPGRPLAVEFRDVSWDRDEVRMALAERGIAWVVADLPPGPRSVPPRDVAQAGLAYLRLHGRNEAWYRPGVGRDRRYDHLYGLEALDDFAARIRRLQQEAARVVVVTNNHFSGKAIVNALELKARLGSGPVTVPERLAIAYPRLRTLAGASDAAS